MIPHPALDVATLEASSIQYELPKGVISLHLGHPAQCRLPHHAIARASVLASEHVGGDCAQYCIEEGVAELRHRIVDEYAAKCSGLSAANVLITQGTSEAIMLMSSLYVDSGTLVILERPSYPWALRLFKLFRGRIQFAECDSNGILPEALACILRDHRRQSSRALLYVMPHFQNPSGLSYSEERRRCLLRIAEECDLVVLEDDAYRYLHFETEDTPRAFLHTACDLGMSHRVLHAGTFSKVYGPGLRVGWLIGEAEIVAILGKMKQAGTSAYASYTIISLLDDPVFGLRGEYIRENRAFYRAKRDALIEGLRARDLASHGITVSRPTGGFYVWLSWPSGLASSGDICSALANKGVLALDGKVCLPPQSSVSGIRLSFSYEPCDRLREGAALVAEYLCGLSAQLGRETRIVGSGRA